MFEYYILGIPRITIPSTNPFSPGVLSNVSPGTCTSPSTSSYFPPLPIRRSSSHRLGSLGGLENALAAIEKGVEIEKDEVDTGLCLTPKWKQDMFLAGDHKQDETAEEKQEDSQHTMMRRRRELRGRGVRRMAMMTDHIGAASAEEFVEGVEKQQEEHAIAFRTRMAQAAEEDIRKAHTPNPCVEEDNNAFSVVSRAGDCIPREPVQLGRNPAYPSPSHESHMSLPPREIEQPRSRSSSVNGPSAHWLKEYSSPIARAHILERRRSFSTGNDSVLHARVHKRICQRRGM